MSTLAALWRHREGRWGLIISVLLVLVAFVGPLVIADPNATNYMTQLAAPSGKRWCGTDDAGRDLLARSVMAARTSLGAALIVFVITSLVGLTLGVTAGLCRGVVDVVISRATDIMLSLPSLVLALAIVGILGPGFGNLILAMSITGWAGLAKVARTCTLDSANTPFVHASRLAGASTWWLVRHHIVPIAWNKVMVLATLHIGTVILGLGGMSFLGLGAQPPTAEWGNMLAGARASLAVAPWQLIGPSSGLVLSVGAATLLADALRDLSGMDSYEA